MSAATTAAYQTSWRGQAPLIAGFVLLLAIAASFVWLVISNHEFNVSVSHTLEVRNTAYRLLTLIQDAETGERGYLLTSNVDYLKPYEIGREEAPLAFEQLQKLVGDNDLQKAAMTRLRAGMEDKLADLRLTVGLNRQGKHDEALAHVNLNVGNEMMQRIRVEVGRVEDQEESMQDSLSAAAEKNNRLLALASITGLLIVLGLAAYSVTSSRRSTVALLAAQDDLRHTNENLEGLVAERVAELQSANEEIQRFAYIVSHDLRAPLVNVMGFTSELDATRSEIADFFGRVQAAAPALATPAVQALIETDLPEALGFIRSSTAKMDRLINAILKLSREGRRVLTPQKLDIRDIVESHGKSLTQQLAAGEAELVVQGDLPGLVGDQLAVEQIFGNLIENATKYLTPGRPGRIVVSGKLQGGYARYDIEDNGRGIAAKDFERIFELFRRSGEQDKPGEGIGLAYVRNLSRRLGGNVSVQSEFGKGSTFTVVLPTSPPKKARLAS